jgi:hypothetical protein
MATETKKVEVEVKAKVNKGGPIEVMNTASIPLNLESGIIQPNETGMATAAEVSNFSGKYLEVV